MACRRLILFYFVVIILITPALFWFGHPVVTGVIWALAGWLFFIPSVIPNNELFGPVISRFPTEKREVWLTIDDGPDPRDTPAILELLQRFNVRATFFLIGKRAAQHPDLVREIYRQGHALGNHTFTHPQASFWMAHPGRLHREIDRCSAALSAILPETKLSDFRAPVGMVNFFLHPALWQKNLRLIGWSSRGFDSVWTDPDKIINRIWEGVSPGAIILLHQGNHPAGMQPVNPRCLELLLKRLKSEGYTAVIPNREALETME